MYKNSIFNSVIIFTILTLSLSSSVAPYHISNDESNTNSLSNCRMQLDLLLIIDESTSIKIKDWEKLVPFVKEIVSSLDIGYKKVRLSLMTYGSAIRNLISFTDEASKSKMKALAKVEDLWSSKAKSGLTYTGSALEFAKEVTFKFGTRNKVPKAIILITDGASTDQQLTSQVSAELRNEGVSILVVGVDKASPFECRHIAGCHESHGPCPTFISTNWSELEHILGGLMKQVCASNPKDAVCTEIWSEWSRCSAKCGSGIRTKQLLELQTQKPEEIGENGRRGKSCCEQFSSYEPVNEICAGKPCSIDAVASEWSEWSTCNATCGPGSMTRYRYEKQKAEGHGRTIEELGIDMLEQKRCFIKECEQDAGCGIFGEWSDCKQSCGSEIKRRRRVYWNDPTATFGGKSCEDQGLKEVEEADCGNPACPKGFIGQWNEWSECNENFERTRRRMGHEGNEKVITISGRKIEVLQTQNCQAGETPAPSSGEDGTSPPLPSGNYDIAPEVPQGEEEGGGNLGSHSEEQDTNNNGKNKDETDLNRLEDDFDDDEPDYPHPKEFRPRAYPEEQDNKSGRKLNRMDDDFDDSQPGGYPEERKVPGDMNKPPTGNLDSSGDRKNLVRIYDDLDDTKSGLYWDGGFQHIPTPSSQERNQPPSAQEGVGNLDSRSRKHLYYDLDTDSEPISQEGYDSPFEYPLEPRNLYNPGNPDNTEGYPEERRLPGDMNKPPTTQEGVVSPPTGNLGSRGLKTGKQNVLSSPGKPNDSDKQKSSDEGEKNKTKFEEKDYRDFKIAGGIFGGLALLGAGGFAYYKKYSNSAKSNREVVNYEEDGLIEYNDDEEKFTVTEIDDTLWGEN